MKALVLLILFTLWVVPGYCETMEVKFGQRVRLKCESKTPGTVSWVIPTSGGRHVHRGRTYLSFILANLNEYGEYICYRTDLQQEPVRQNSFYIMRPVRVAQNIRVEKNVDLLEQVTLECPGNFGSGNTRWMFFNKGDGKWKIMATRSRTHVIPEIRPEQMTTWRCESITGLRDSKGKRRYYFHLFSFFRHGKTTLIEDNELAAYSNAHYLLEDKPTFSLECEKPIGSIVDAQRTKWFFKNYGGNRFREIGINGQQYENMRVDASEDTSILVIRKLTVRQNHGYYKCITETGTEKFGFTYIMAIKPKIHLYGGGKTRFVKNGETVMYLCDTASKEIDTTEIYWQFLRQGLPDTESNKREFRIGDVDSGNGVKVRVQGTGSQLRIEEVQDRHHGKYFCVFRGKSDNTVLMKKLDGIVVTLEKNRRGSRMSLKCKAEPEYDRDKRTILYRYRYYKYNVETGQWEESRRYSFVDAYTSKDRRFRCSATRYGTSTPVMSNEITLKKLVLTLVSLTPPGLREGSDFKMKCILGTGEIGNIVHQIRLYKNNRYARARKTYPEVTDASVSRTFDFEVARARHSGEYFCQIRSRGVNVKSNSIWISVCRTNQFMCRDMKRCIDKRYQCDGENHCLDRSDEAVNQCSPCEPHSLPCQHNRGIPPGAKCVLKHWICDGQDDCENGWDEVVDSRRNPYCLVHPSPTSCPGCGRNETCCSGGKCFPRAYECDKEPDCEGGEDERYCQCDQHEAGIVVESPFEETTKLVEVGQTNVELICSVRSKERATISWRFNWGHLPDASRFKESMTITSPSPSVDSLNPDSYTVEGKLIISRINPETDFGRYTCEAITKCRRVLSPDFIVKKEVYSP